jgi:hypothetical protein
MRRVRGIEQDDRVGDECRLGRPARAAAVAPVVEQVERVVGKRGRLSETSSALPPK